MDTSIIIIVKLVKADGTSLRSLPYLSKHCRCRHSSKILLTILNLCHRFFLPNIVLKHSRYRFRHRPSIRRYNFRNLAHLHRNWIMCKSSQEQILLLAQPVFDRMAKFSILKEKKWHATPSQSLEDWFIGQLLVHLQDRDITGSPPVPFFSLNFILLLKSLWLTQIEELLVLRVTIVHNECNPAQGDHIVWIQYFPPSRVKMKTSAKYSSFAEQ